MLVASAASLHCVIDCDVELKTSIDWDSARAHLDASLTHVQITGPHDERLEPEDGIKFTRSNESAKENL